MGPPIFIGGSPYTVYFVYLVSSGFNGATDFHRWKSIAAPTDVQKCLHASMGPPIFIGGLKFGLFWSRVQGCLSGQKTLFHRLIGRV